MAARAENIGVQKADMGWKNTVALGVLAGAFTPMGLFIKLGAPEAFYRVVG